VARPTTSSEQGFGLFFGRDLATFAPEDLATERFSIELALSLWMRRTGTDRERIVPALLRLREALLDASALDAATEPVPLLPRHPAVALRSLCTYLYGLIDRAARSTGLGHIEIVEAALASGGPNGGSSHGTTESG